MQDKASHPMHLMQSKIAKCLGKCLLVRIVFLFCFYKYLLNYLKYSFIQLILLVEMLPMFIVKNANARELKHLIDTS